MQKSQTPLYWAWIALAGLTTTAVQAQEQPPTSAAPPAGEVPAAEAPAAEAVATDEAGATDEAAVTDEPLVVPGPEARPAPSSAAPDPVGLPRPDSEPVSEPSSKAAEAPSAEASPPPFAEDEAQVTAERPLDNSKSRFRLGKGLVFESEDGEFAMVPRLRAQFLYTASAEDGAAAEQSFQIRRARLQFGGHFWGKNNRYKAEFAVSPRDEGMAPEINGGVGTTPLLDWYLDFTHLRDMGVRVGQSKVPFNRQRVISSGDLQLVDRSIVNARFNVDRDLGIDIRSSDFLGLDMLRYYLGVYAGEGRNTFSSNDFGMMYLARLEFQPFGDFKDYKEGDHQRYRTPKVSIGLGAGYIDRAKGNRGILGRVPADGGTTDFTLLNADMMFKFMGLSVFSEFILRDGKRNPGDAVDDAGDPIPVEQAATGWGWMAQGGYLIPTTNLEVVARYGLIKETGDDSTLVPETEVGGGLGYYFAHHAFKIQADVFHLTEGMGDQQVRENRFRVQLQAAY